MGILNNLQSRFALADSSTDREFADSDIFASEAVAQTSSMIQGYFSGGGGPNRIRPDKAQIQEYRETYRANPYLSAGIDLRAGETVRPGYKINTKDDDLTAALREWTHKMTVYAGQYDQPLLPQLWMDARNHDLDGTVFTEHMYDNPQDPQVFAGIQPIDPVTVDTLCYPGTSRIVRPNSSSENVPRNMPTNVRGEYAAYLQRSGEAGANLSKGLTSFNNREDLVPLSQNDVTTTVRNPAFDTPGHTGSTGRSGQTRGISLAEPVVEEAQRVQQLKKDHAAAMQNLAYPRIIVQFENAELADGNYIKWTNAQMKRFVRSLRSRGGNVDNRAGYNEGSDGHNGESINDGGEPYNAPGGIMGAPPATKFEVIAPDVPDIDSHIQLSIDTVFSGMNVPKAFVGFGDNVNRDVTEPRAEQFQRDISQVRSHIDKSYTQIFRKKAEYLINRGIVSVPEESLEETLESVEFKIAGNESTSPMQDEDFDASEFLNYMKALKVYSQGGVDAYIPPEQMIEHDLGLDYEELEAQLKDAAEAMQSADADALNQMRQSGTGPPTADEIEEQAEEQAEESG